MAILGLSINTRMLGLAIISGNLLIDYHIQLRKEPWTPQKRDLILTSLQPWCASYNINSIALSIAHEKQTSTQTKELLESIKSYFRERKINLYSYPPKALHSFCKEVETKTKKEMMREVALKYPEISHLYRKEMSSKNKYYIKLFEAVAVGVIHSRRMKEL